MVFCLHWNWTATKTTVGYVLFLAPRPPRTSSGNIDPDISELKRAWKGFVYFKSAPEDFFQGTPQMSIFLIYRIRMVGRCLELDIQCPAGKSFKSPKSLPTLNMLSW